MAAESRRKSRLCIGIFALLLVACGSEPVTEKAPPSPVQAGGGSDAKSTAPSYPAAVTAPAPPAPVVRIVERHVWSPLSAHPSEPWKGNKYGMYTYVLFNGPTTGTLSYVDKRALADLERLLASIANPEYTTASVDADFRGSTNLFLIPGKAKKEGGIAYDAVLSRRYLDYFGKAFSSNAKLQKRIVNRSGPFLVATYQPLDKVVWRKSGKEGFAVDSSQAILLVDLTGANEKNVPEVVQSFKKFVGNDVYKGVSMFEPLRVSIANVLLNVNDVIPFVNNAVAGTCKMIGAEKVCMQ
ncbi:hypothetical protein EGT07_03540 [Herbaspirillum sp. HC18]|nr:hypothetical protein EGT07_03540 [Herbaspirillum sp. HC18]